MHMTSTGLDNTLAEYMRIQQERAFTQDPTITNDQETPTPSERARKLLRQLLFRFDFATNLYMAYSVIAMLVVSPYVLFVTGLATKIRRVSFGIQKLQFVLLVLAVWFGYEYVSVTLNDPDVTMYFIAARANPWWVSQ